MSLQTELRRKSLHFSALIIPVGYAVLPTDVAWRLLILGSVTVVFLDLVRLGHPGVQRYVKVRAGELMRVRENTSLLGSSYLVIAAVITVAVFPKPIAVAALLFLTLGDPAAAVVGMAFGRIRVFGKTLEGGVACFIACFLGGLAVPGIDLETALVGAGVATLAELVPSRVDDNFAIPLLGGLGMLALARLK